MPHPAADCNPKKSPLKRTSEDESGARPSLRLVMETVSRRFGVPIIDLKSARRDRPTAWARQCFCLLARERTGLSYHRIALTIGGRDHSTVMYAVRTARERLDIDEGYAELYRSCARDLGRLL